MQPERQNLAQKSVGFSLLLTSVENHLMQRSGTSVYSTNQQTALHVATQLWALAHGVATLEGSQMLGYVRQISSGRKYTYRSHIGTARWRNQHRH
jgi:hypothetical protein